MIVSSYMTPRPVTVSGKAPGEYALDLMRRHQVFQLPVVDDIGQLVGILTDRDLRSAAGADPDLLKNLVVNEIMTSEVITVGPDDDIQTALEILCRKRVGGLPVVREGVLVGIITVRDMLRCLRDQLGMPSILHDERVARAHTCIF